MYSKRSENLEKPENCTKTPDENYIIGNPYRSNAEIFSVSEPSIDISDNIKGLSDELKTANLKNSPYVICKKEPW